MRKAKNETCWLKQKSTHSLGTVVHWELLRDLLKKQNYKCAYTGKKLVLGVNASIDHIRPKSLFPELANDPNNIVWVDLKVNKLKHNKPLEEFMSEFTS